MTDFTQFQFEIHLPVRRDEQFDLLLDYRAEPGQFDFYLIYAWRERLKLIVAERVSLYDSSRFGANLGNRDGGTRDGFALRVSYVSINRSGSRLRNDRTG